MSLSEPISPFMKLRFNTGHQSWGYFTDSTLHNAFLSIGTKLLLILLPSSSPSLHIHLQALKPADMGSLEIKSELETCLFSQSRPASCQRMAGLAVQSEFQLQILNPLVPRGCCSINPSLIGVESPYYLEKNLSQL